MSWIIQHLLSNKTRIKESTNIFDIELRGMNPFRDTVHLDSESNIGYLDPKLENDEYNNLLLVEKAIKDLKERGAFTDEDLEIIKFVEDGNIFFSGKTDFDVGKITLSKRFETLCERIAFYMGGYFTNDGFIDYMEDKYDLTEEQVKSIREYIQSKYRHLLYKEKDKNEIDG